MYKGLIFDCFGVIITDQVGLTLAAFQEQNAGNGNKVFALLQATNDGGISWQDFVTQAAVLMEITAATLNTAFTNNEVKNTELLATIRQLRGPYQTAMLTNTSTQGFWERFTTAELEPYFDVVLLSGETGIAKPEAAAYALAAERLKLRQDECIMIDDREEYCIGARVAGMQAIRYESVPQLRAELERHGISWPELLSP